MFRLKNFGWKKDRLDRRDNLFRVSKPVMLPPTFSLVESKHMPPVVDQGDLGSCTANAIAGCIDFEHSIQHSDFITPSRLFIYYNERVMEGTVSEDSGAEIRDGIKSVNSSGVCAEKDWPYDPQKFADKPSDSAFVAAELCKALKYQKLVGVHSQIGNALYVNQRPIAFGVVVYESFEDDVVVASGNVPMPGPGEQQIGGHAIMLVGYDDSRQVYTFRNSWGTGYGKAGYGTLPYAYVHDANLASDFWQIQLEN
jgi:C1A family cysteine protease